MYIVAIAWLYVVLMMSITEQTAVAGVMTFLLYGALPMTILLYLMDTPRRKRNRQMAKKKRIDAASGRRPAKFTGRKNTRLRRRGRELSGDIRAQIVSRRGTA